MRKSGGGWSAAALADRFKENPDVGIHRTAIASLLTTPADAVVNVQREYDLQEAVFAEIKNRILAYPLYSLIFPVPNGQYRDGQRPEAGLEHGAGYPDFAWDLPRGIYHGYRCELKIKKNKVKECQAWWGEQLTAQGFFVVTIRDSLSEVMKSLDGYYALGPYKPQRKTR